MEIMAIIMVTQSLRKIQSLMIKLKSLYEDVEYDRRKSFEFVADLVSSVKQYRTTAKRFSS